MICWLSVLIGLVLGVPLGLLGMSLCAMAGKGTR